MTKRKLSADLEVKPVQSPVRRLGIRSFARREPGSRSRPVPRAGSPVEAE
jgi:hypothetical protein